VALNSQKLDKIAENHAEIYHVLGPNFGPWISHIFKTWYTKNLIILNDTKIKFFLQKKFGVLLGGGGGGRYGVFFFRHMAHIRVRFQPENVGILKPTTSEPSADHPKIAG
jgi:hypothetical protein